MDEELLEQMVFAIGSAFVVAGAKDFEDGLRIVKKLVGFIYEAIQPIETRADFKSALAASALTLTGEMAKAMLLMQNLPSVVRFV